MPSISLPRLPLSLAAAAAVAVAAACSRPLPRPAPEPLAGPCADSVEVTFLGTQGFWIRHGDDVVMSGPLFTLPRFARTISRYLTVRADTTRVRETMERYVPAEERDRGRLRAIFAGHGHYDHVMDVPPLVATFFSRPGDARDSALRIYVNRATKHVLAGEPASLVDRLEVVDRVAGDSHEAGRWLYPPGDSTVRLMAIRSEHGPQFGRVKVFHADRLRPRAELPRTAWGWPEGQSHAYVVEFLDRATRRVVFRIYYNDTTARGPEGVPPVTGELEGRFDLALLTMGSFREAGRAYPGWVLSRTRPRHVLAGHWEDFFQPHTDPPRVLPLHRVGEWQRRVHATLAPDATYAMPAPGDRHTYCVAG